MSALLADLLARLGAAPDHVVDLGGDELAGWPPALVAALKLQRFLLPAQPAASLVCPGCERACTMAVTWRMRASGSSAAFVYCDKRDDMGAVPLDASMLERWRVSDASLAGALAGMLSEASQGAAVRQGEGWRLGVVRGQAGGAVVSLRFAPGMPVLQVAGHEPELASLLSLREGRLVLDLPFLARCASAPAPGAGMAGETPQQRTDRLRRRKAELVAQGVKAFLQRIADEENLSVSMVKKNIGRGEPAAPASAVQVLAAWPGGVSARPKRKR